MRIQFFQLFHPGIPQSSRETAGRVPKAEIIRKPALNHVSFTQEKKKGEESLPCLVSSSGTHGQEVDRLSADGSQWQM